MNIDIFVFTVCLLTCPVLLLSFRNKRKKKRGKPRLTQPLLKEDQTSIVSFSLDSLKHTGSRGSLLHWNNIDQYLSLLSRLTTTPHPPPQCDMCTPK